MNDDIIEGTNVLKLHSMDAYMEHVHSHSSSHVDHMDPSLMVFFFMETQGWEKETLPTSYPGKNPIQFLSHYNKFQIFFKSFHYLKALYTSQSHGRDTWTM